VRVDDPTAVTTVRRDWVGDEAALPGTWAELKRLLGRARRRWLRTLLWALLVTALAVGVAARRPPVYTTRLVFHVDSGAVVPGDASRAVLSDAQLGAVIALHGLYAHARDKTRAVAAMRADLEVSFDGSELALAWHGDDARRVFETVRDLGRIVGGEQGWRLVDPGHVDSSVPRVTFLGVLGAVVLVLALPLCGLGVGAFDRRVYDLDDVRRLGLPTLGAVRRFDGDNAGSLDARLAHDPHDRMRR
jgi:hypothetical protein